MESVKTWVEISSRRLIANYNLLQRAAGPDTTVLAVIKANAYGHSAELCALTLARAGAPWLGVADPQEGASVRRALTAAGLPQPRILVMSAPLQEDTTLLFEYNLTPALWLPDHIDWLTAAATKASAPLPIHLEIDTGMARQGIAPGPELDTLLHSLQHNQHLHLEGLLTHFACSEAPNSPVTHLQRTRFEQAVAQVKSAGFTPGWLHAGNSSTLDVCCSEDTLPWLKNLATSAGAKPMVRTGIALYGYCLPTRQPQVQPELQPVLTWKTRIAALRNLSPGDTVGYNATYTAEKPTRLALLPIGYSDGLRRELSGSTTRTGGWAILHGQRAPIVGRISMNLTTVDVTGISGASIDDEVILLGDGITADDHAHLANTISYEILCAIRAPATLL